MGVFGALGKMAGSKVIEKVEDELTKKQNRDQTSGYCNYINNNSIKLCGTVSSTLNAFVPINRLSAHPCYEV